MTRSGVSKGRPPRKPLRFLVGSSILLFSFTSGLVVPRVAADHPSVPCDQPSCIQTPGPKIIVEMGPPEVVFQGQQNVTVVPQQRHGLLHHLFHHRHHHVSQPVFIQPVTIPTMVAPVAVPQMAAIPVAMPQVAAMPMAMPQVATVQAPAMTFAPQAVMPAFAQPQMMVASPQVMATPSFMPASTPCTSTVPSTSGCQGSPSGASTSSLENLIKLKITAQALESKASALLMSGMADSMAMQNMALATLTNGKGGTQGAGTVGAPSSGADAATMERLQKCEQALSEIKGMLNQLANPKK